MGCLHGVYRSAVSARSTPAVDHRQRDRTAAADCSAVFDGSMPIWFWIIGMLLAFACMYATILLGAGTGKREGL